MRDVDSLLAIDHDRRLRSFGRILANCFIAVVAIGHSIMVTMIVIRLNVKGNYVANNHIVFVGMFIWMIYDAGSFTMPDFNFLFMSKAIEIRLRRIRRELGIVVSLSCFDLSSEFEKYRIAYQLLMDMVQETNYVLSPVLLVACIMNGSHLVMSIYALLPQESSSFGWKLAKIVFGVIGFAKFGLICSAGSSVEKAVCISAFLCIVHSCDFTRHIFSFV